MAAAGALAEAQRERQGGGRVISLRRLTRETLGLEREARGGGHVRRFLMNSSAPGAAGESGPRRLVLEP